MENLFLTILLIVGIVILAIPQSVSRTIKKAMPVLLLFIAVFGIGFFVKNQTNSEIRITASNTKNEKAEGSEIFLKEVIVNGETKKPVEIFSDGWIEKDGGLLWRDYDQKDGMKDSIYANFQSGDDVILVLKQNKWQGEARIISVQGDQGFDGYADSESENWMNFEVKMKSTAIATRRSLMLMATIMWIFLVGISFVCKRFLPEPHKENKERLIGLDLLKIVSAFMIAVIHASSGVFNNHEIGSLVWKEGLVLNALTRFAVPTFLMISGALLLGRKISLNKALKRAAVAGIALFVWSFTYIIVRKILWSEGNFFNDIIMLLFKRGPSGHLWYGYLLVWIYLFSPVLSNLYESLSEKIRWYFILLGLVIPSILDAIINYFSLDGQILQNPFFIYIHLGYIAIMFLGRMIYENRKKWSAFIGLSSTVVGFLITVFLTVSISKRMGASTHTFFNELELSNVLYAFGIMLLVCKIDWKGDGNFINRLIIKISELSMGIYFAHVLIMWFLGDTISVYGTVFNIESSVPECLLFVCIIFVGTIVAISPLGNIPFLKKLVKVS